MATQPKNQIRLCFGPFEVDLASGELRRSGIRLRLSGQPFQILQVLLAHPGEIVTREKLRQEIWVETTFVDFEHGLNAAMNKLRRVLGDTADDPRYIETVPGRGYRFIGTLAAPLPDHNVTALAPVARRRYPPFWWWLAAAVGCAASLAVGSRFGSPDSGANLPPSKLTRLTSDSGFSGAPALSADGKLAAYASDRAKEGELDLYVQQTLGGQPIRLTFDGAGNTTPDFSPDASKIVFRSSRDGGGIYEIAALGGEARLLARDGLYPRYSPDGRAVAYWVGAPNVAQGIPGSGSVWVVPIAKGEPRRIGSSFTTARYPIWSPDSKRVLVVGYASEKVHDPAALDWWIVDAESDAITRTGAFAALARAGLTAEDPGGAPLRVIPVPSIPAPQCWLPDNKVVFAIATGDASNLWSTEVVPSGGISSRFQRLTAGSGNDGNPTCASGGAIAFASMEDRRQVWLYPFDLNQGRATGTPERITEDLAFHADPSLTADGRHVAFSSARIGRLNIWLRDLDTRKESRIAPSPLAQRFPVISPTGKKIAFAAYEGDKRLVYVLERNGIAEKVCEGCLRAMAWTQDEKALLVVTGSPYQIDLLDLTTRQQTALLSHPDYHLLYARFSPDYRWISFTARTSPSHSWIVIAPFDGPKPIPESSWIKIAEEGIEDRADWSPDGRTLLFTSERDGHMCLWSQHLDGRTRQPSGEAFPYQHFHGRGVLQKLGWSAAGGAIGVVLLESKANVWMMRRP
jgi:Tol biopolymer transport system component/DNA-binding winged helix-turn-helix (wHTH) protein